MPLSKERKRNQRAAIKLHKRLEESIQRGTIRLEESPPQTSNGAQPNVDSVITSYPILEATLKAFPELFIDADGNEMPEEG